MTKHSIIATIPADVKGEYATISSYGISVKHRRANNSCWPYQHLTTDARWVLEWIQTGRLKDSLKEKRKELNETVENCLKTTDAE